MYGKTTEKLAFEKKLASIPGGIIFGWLGDKIGRRKVFMMMILTLSFATGVTVRAARRARDRMPHRCLAHSPLIPVPLKSASPMPLIPLRQNFQ